MTGSLVATTAAILGCFLVLRKMAMIGDAISHAVLPGIVIAFLISGVFDSWVMVIGASAVGLLTTFLIELLNKRAKMQNDAAIGVVFTFLFAVGVILISAYAGSVDLDTECVLYGEIAYVPLETSNFQIFGNFIPTPSVILGVVFLIVLAFVIIGFKGLSLTTFDEEYAQTIGISTTMWHYFLMAAVSLTTVVSFESVGAVLVVAFLVCPAVIAYLLTDNLKIMLLISCAAGIIASIFGYFIASQVDGSITGAMVMVLGIEFLIVLFFAPKYGVLGKLK